MTLIEGYSYVTIGRSIHLLERGSRRPKTGPAACGLKPDQRWRWSYLNANYLGNDRYPYNLCHNCKAAARRAGANIP